MARGNYWEATYDPEWDGPADDVELDDMDGSTGYVRRRIVSPPDTSVRIKWKAQAPQRRFQDCDIATAVGESHVSNCTFSGCRFRDSLWSDVKFSNCHFERCDFSQSTFKRCTFIRNCTFEGNTASAELFRIEDTALSARHFMAGLHPNLEHVVREKHAYQRYRFTRTREKLAMALYNSTRNEADVEYYFEAYEELTRAHLAYNVERHRFTDDDKPVSRGRFWLRSAPARFERSIVVLSGNLTNWGRSLLRAALFFLAVVTVFSAAYLLRGATLRPLHMEQGIGDAVLEAVNVTLVAGFTAYFDGDESGTWRLIWTINCTLGLFWYSLVVPVLARRILR